MKDGMNEWGDQIQVSLGDAKEEKETLNLKEAEEISDEDLRAAADLLDKLKAEIPENFSGYVTCPSCNEKVPMDNTKGKVTELECPACKDYILFLEVDNKNKM